MKSQNDITGKKTPLPIPHFLNLRAINPKEKWLYYWSMLIISLKLINSVLAPLILAWTTEFDHSIIYIVYFTLTDILFVVYEVTDSLKIKEDKYGRAITDVAKLLKGHFGKWKWLKLVFCLPFEYFSFFVNEQFFHLYEKGVETVLQSEYQYTIWALVRVIKVFFQTPYSIIFALNIPNVQLPISRLINTMLILMVLGHIDGCFFWFLEKVISPASGKRWVDVNNLIFRDDEIVPFKTQYLQSYLTALRSLVLKLRSVYLDPENVYVVLEFIAGILAYGTVFGNIHSIVEMMDKNAVKTHAEEQHVFTLEMLKRYMKEKGLKPELQKAIYGHKELQFRRTQGMDHEKLFDDIPKQVQQEVKIFMYQEMIQSVPLFKGTGENFQKSIVFKIQPLDILKNSFLFRKGDEGLEMYFIKTGEVAILGEQGQVFTRLKSGNFFGEIALFEDCKRTASAFAATHLELYTLNKKDFIEIVNQYPEVADRVIESIQSRKLNESKIKTEEAKKKLTGLADPTIKEEEEKSRKESSGSFLGKARGTGSFLGSFLAPGQPGSKGEKLGESFSRTGSFFGNLLPQTTAGSKLKNEVKVDLV